MEKRSSVRKATSDEIVSIYEMLTKHGERKNEVYVYEEGWSDERIAAEANRGGDERPLGSSAVARIRVKSTDRAGMPIFGCLPATGPGGGSGLEALASRVSKIEKALLALSNCVGSSQIKAVILSALEIEGEEE